MNGIVHLVECTLDLLVLLHELVLNTILARELNADSVVIHLKNSYLHLDVELGLCLVLEVDVEGEFVLVVAALLWLNLQLLTHVFNDLLLNHVWIVSGEEFCVNSDKLLVRLHVLEWLLDLEAFRLGLLLFVD